MAQPDLYLRLIFVICGKSRSGRYSMHGKKVGFTETVLRDGAQSLIATRLSYDKMEPVLKTMNETGYYSAEVWGGATFDVCLRFLNEDPWERLRKIREKMPDTKLQMLLRGQNILGYKHYPDNS